MFALEETRIYPCSVPDHQTGEILGVGVSRSMLACSTLSSKWIFCAVTSSGLHGCDRAHYDGNISALPIP